MLCAARVRVLVQTSRVRHCCQQTQSSSRWAVLLEEATTPLSEGRVLVLLCMHTACTVWRMHAHSIQVLCQQASAARLHRPDTHPSGLHPLPRYRRVRPHAQSPAVLLSVHLAPTMDGRDKHGADGAGTFGTPVSRDHGSDVPRSGSSVSSSPPLSPHRSLPPTSVERVGPSRISLMVTVESPATQSGCASYVPRTFVFSDLTHQTETGSRMNANDPRAQRPL